MSIFKLTRIQWLTALFPLPLVVMLFLYLIVDFSSISSVKFSLVLSVFLPFSFLSWYTFAVINNYITSKLPQQSQTVKRGIVSFGIHFFWLVMVSWFLFGTMTKLSFFKVDFTRENLLSSIVLGGVFNIIFTVIWQVEYIFKSWEKTREEKEWMERELLQQEFDRLKQQLNPHFLFNNLNVLSSLISADPKKASYYLDELSKIYRYLLRRGNEDLATLEDELAFIRSYAALLKIRFGNAVQMNIEAGEKKSEGMLPIQSLQLLVENAIKHNTADKILPLKISIRVIDNQTVEVRNNLRRKQASVPSNKVGLANIQTKYRMLNIENMTVRQTEEYFEVKLPLITSLTTDKNLTT